MSDFSALHHPLVCSLAFRLFSAERMKLFKSLLVYLYSFKTCSTHFGTIAMPVSTKCPEGIPLHHARVQKHARRPSNVLQLIATSLLLYASISCYYYLSFQSRELTSTPYQKAQQCTIANLHADLSFLDPAVPISAEEFLERRDRLAHALVASNVDAFVLEPGYTFQ